MEQTIIPPDLDDLLAESRDSVFSNLNCIQVGKLEKVNDDQTVEVKIQFLRRLPGGKTSKYPLLVDCPYFVLQGGGAYIDMPIKKGDDCLVLFNDRNIDDWWDTANVAVPADTRKHSISDGFALIGINSRTKALSFDGANLRIIVPGGIKISIGNGTDELLSLFNDNLTEVIKSLKFIRDTITFSNGGGPTGPPANGSVLSPTITALEATKTALGNIKG